VANLDPPPRSNSTRRDRGQIVLLAAFALAVAFVVLALVVNSAIFTENLATREEVAGSDDALDHRYEVQTNVEELILAANANNSYDGDLEPNIESMGEEGRDQQATLGRIANVKDVQLADGIKIAQDQPRNFTSNETSEDWTVAKDVEKIRNLQMNVTDLDDLPDWDPLNPIPLDPFQLAVSNSSVEWNMTVSDEIDLSGGDIAITVQTPDGDTASCERDIDGEYATIDVTGGLVNGTACPALSQLDDGTEMWLGTGVEPDPEYEIEFRNGDEINGTYSFIVDGGATEGNEDYFGDPPDEPYYKDGTDLDNTVIYSVDLTYEYYTPSVGYETDIRVAPGEPPE